MAFLSSPSLGILSVSRVITFAYRGITNTFKGDLYYDYKAIIKV